jgi:hypothetical protein
VLANQFLHFFMVGAKALLKGELESIGYLGKCHAELLVFGFRVFIHVLASVVSKHIAHLLILRIVGLTNLLFGV